MSDPATACACARYGGDADGIDGPASALSPAQWRHGAIRERLLDRIAHVAVDGTRPLAALTTRRLDDPAIALVDAFAGSLHVLAWNAARLADDATLERGQDPQALGDLVALTGYTPRPALSATTTLAYTLDAFPGAPAEVVIPVGNKVASLPAPGEQPVIFETDAPLVARPEWNALLPVVPRVRPPVTATTDQLEVAGERFVGKPGDMVAVVLDAPDGTKTWLIAQVIAMTMLDALDPPRVRLTLGDQATVAGPAVTAADKGSVVLLGRRAVAFGAMAPDPLLLLKRGDAGGADPLGDRIEQPANSLPEWKDLHLAAPGATDGSTVDLDGVVEQAVAGRLMLIVGSQGAQLGAITKSATVVRRGFGLSGKVTRTSFADASIAGVNGEVRTAWFAIEAVRYPLSSEPDPAAVCQGDAITVEGAVTLPQGRALLLTGMVRDAVTSLWTASSEIATVNAASSASVDPPRTRITFAAPLTQAFQASSLSIRGNAVPASHGERAVTGAELLGSSDAGVIAPRFRLTRKPLTRLPAEGAQGYAAAIEVRVADRRYEPLPTLYDVPADVRGYRIESDHDGNSYIRFAARLPTGTNSVSATYRAGAGAAGNLAPGRLTTALAPVPGVRAVTNPVPADGGSDGETIDAMRRAAPRQLGTFDRIVSLADVEAFASGYRGVGKAAVSEVRHGIRPVVILTIASTSLRQPDAALIEALDREIASRAPPGWRLRIQGFTILTAAVTIAFAADPALRRADVEAAIRAMLGARFGATARRFGEALTRSAVLAAVQDVPGVTAAMLSSFGIPGGAVATDGRLMAPVVEARATASGGVDYTLAGLLAIDPQQVQFAELPA